jgi:hypothetical protein
MMHTVRLSLVLACTLSLGLTTRAAVEFKEVADLTAEARQIVVGDVSEVTSFWDQDHELIKSRIVVQVSDYLVGAGSGTEILEMSGGTVGDLTLHVSVLPQFEPGDHVLLFLGDSEIRLVQSFQGAYLTDGVWAARMAPACGRVIEESLQPLVDLLSEIEGALPPGSRLPELRPYEGDFEIPLGGSRYGLCGYSWAYQANPMGEDYVINANCADSSAGDADSQRTQIQNGAAAWNNAGADFAFSYGGTSSLTSVNYNGVNLVYFDTTPPDGGGYVAATYIWASGGNISENDMVFNDAQYTWWNGSGACLNQMDIWNIATHEFGHYLCLADLYGGADSAKTMYGYVSYCDIHARDLHEDDINGIIAIYGGGSGGYCAASSNSTSYEYISNVSVGSIDNSSSSSGYADYTSLSTDMNIGAEYPITVTLDTTWSTDIGGLWIDWNQDEDFDDPGETITTAWSGLGPYTTTITPPSGALEGSTRLRVRIQDGDYDPTLSSCGTTSYGEVEDYTVNVGGGCDEPQFVVQPEPSQEVCAGDTVLLSVQVDIAMPDYQWRRGTTELVDDGVHIIGATSSTLLIVDVTPADQATDYNCFVTNLADGCTAASNDAEIIVDEDVPVILSQPQDLTVTEGDVASFAVGVDIPQLYTYQWRRDGLDLSDDARHIGTTTHTLTITPVELGDAGVLDCVVTHQLGGMCATTSDGAVLTVTEAQECPGDLDGDGDVDLSDLSQLLANYGTNGGAAPEDGDLDGDGDVDLSDLSALLAVYGTQCP